MSIFSDAFGFLFGGESADPDWGDIERLMKFDAALNRIDQHGPFASWTWDQGGGAGGGNLSDVPTTQRFSINPNVQPAFDRFTGRMNEGYSDPYTSPSQFSQLLDAKMANQFYRHGLPENTPDPSMFGPPSASRPGVAPPEFTPAPDLPPPPLPPQQNVPPMQGPPGGGMRNPQNYRRS